MVSFFDQPVKQQIEAAIDSSDPKLVQILLGPKYCQLWKDWLTHSMLSYKLVGVAQALKYQLPINILLAQIEVLESNFSKRMYAGLPTGRNAGEPEELFDLRASSDDVSRVNKELENVEREILKRYKNFKHEIVGDKYKVFNVQYMFNPIRKFDYSYGINDDTEGNKSLKEVTEAFKSNLALQPVLKLDLSDHYSETYDEMYAKITEEYQLRIEIGQSMRSLCDDDSPLRRKFSDLREGDDRLRSILTSISQEVVNGIQNNEFIGKVYDKLIDNVLNIAAKDRYHPLHEDFNNLAGSKEQKIEIIKKRIKEQVSRNSRHECLTRYMDYAVGKDIPSIHIIMVLIANGASLLESYRTDTESITVKQRLQQLGGGYEALIGKSIYTITGKVHKLLFDFPVMGEIEEDVDLLQLVSEIPSEDGYFAESGKNITLLNKIGSEGSQEFINLLKTCVKNTHSEEKQYHAGIRLNFYTTMQFFSDRAYEKDLEEGYAKLYDCINVGYKAVATGDDRVIIDYISEIKEEAEHSRNPHLKKLYKTFSTILSDCNDLPKSMFLSRWFRYLSRTVKSYSGWEWSPAWEKILTGPGYPTDVGEWSNNKFKETAKAELDQLEQRIARANALAEQNAKQKQEAEQRAGQNAQKAKHTSRISQIFSKKTRGLDDDLYDIAIDNQVSIVEAVVEHVMKHNSSPEQLLDSIIEEIKSKGAINSELIESSIRDVPTSLSGASASHSASEGRSSGGRG